MCCGPWSSTLSRRKSSGANPSKSLEPSETFIARPGTSDSPSSSSPRATTARRTPVAPGQREPVRVEGVEGPHERVVREQPVILLAEQQRQAIGLVAVAAMISAQGQEEPEDEEIEQPPGEGRARRAGFGHRAILPAAVAEE